ncbi:hypothetical protein BIY27_25700 [Gibbsiella quercinecans]|uniref:hypothetical protein n=1 Tax=Gibbsiella quercinecans TaxID=929813 RepID=UPI000EF27BA9|nr:hypothetical protein [Gibbsiella quercinecans]RLM02140.1 hypothetical protein BIY27_25700 [Gibbsiella quercinecans]
MLKPQQKPDSKATYSGRVLITLENGNIISERVVGCHEHVASLYAFVELAQAAGWHVSPPEPQSNDVITGTSADINQPQALPTAGEHYTQNKGGMIAIVVAVNGNRVVFSYEQHPNASHDYSLSSFNHDFTLCEKGYSHA